MNILVLNAGSETFKAVLFRTDDKADEVLPDDAVWKGQINWHGQPGSKLIVTVAGKTTIEKNLVSTDVAAGIRELLMLLWTGECSVLAGPGDINIVGHRIVHGGTKYVSSTLITDAVLRDLHDYIDLAPVHEPPGIMGIQIARDVFPEARQVGVFDTAFHQRMPLTATIYAGPYEWYDRLKIRRFGFHGVSHQYCAGRTAQLLSKSLSELSLITCHLGGGSSVTAIKGGVSVMTSMGFTPLEGVVMNTRSGSIDPGLLLYLLERKIYTVTELSNVLQHQSGLKGISGLSGDMTEIEKSCEQGNARAQLAFDVYVQSVASNIAAMVSHLDGLHAISFTGGIGENSSSIRAAICKKLTLLNISVDDQKNTLAKADTTISPEDASVHVCAIRTREDLVIAQESLKTQ